MKSYKFLLPVYILMKLGFFLIPCMAASVWGMPWSIVLYTVIYAGYIWKEGQTVIKEVNIEEGFIEMLPLFGKKIRVEIIKSNFTVHIYKGSKFFESRVITVIDKFHINNNYWNKKIFNNLEKHIETSI